MKLLNHNDELTTGLVADNSYIKRELDYTFDELRLVEDKFYKIFNLNPCPISISDLNRGNIIDVNDAFIETMGLKSKSDIIGKLNVKYKIIKDKDERIVMSKIKESGVIKNYFCEFKTMNGKKKKGLFSGYVMELNGKECLILICQVVNKGFLSSIFKTYFFF